MLKCIISVRLVKSEMTPVVSRNFLRDYGRVKK